MKHGMSVMGKKLRQAVEDDSLKDYCTLSGQFGHVCEGRITREHAMYYAGKKIQERWALVFLCAGGHGVDGYERSTPKDMAEWVALNQATAEDFKRFPRKFPSFEHEKLRLNKKYGMYAPPVPVYQSVI